MTTKRKTTTKKQPDTITPTDTSNPPILQEDEAEVIMSTMAMDDNLEVDDPEAFNAALQARVQAKLKSRAIRTKTISGKAALFNLRTHTNVDYTAGGLFHMRLVANNEDKIRSHRQLNGYKFPEEYEVGLKNLTIASHVLMLCPTESYLERKRSQARENQAHERDRQAADVRSKGEGFGEYEVAPVSRRN